MAQQSFISQLLQRFDPSKKFEDVGGKTRGLKQEKYFSDVIDVIVKKIEDMYAAYEAEMAKRGPLQKILGTVLPAIGGPIGALISGLGSAYDNEQVRKKYEDRLAAVKNQYQDTFLEDYSEGAYENIKEAKDPMLQSSLMGMASSLMVPKMIDWGFEGVGEALKEGPFKKILPGYEEKALAGAGSEFDPIYGAQDLGETFNVEGGSWIPQFEIGEANQDFVSGGTDPVKRWVDEVTEYSSLSPDSQKDLIAKNISLGQYGDDLNILDASQNLYSDMSVQPEAAVSVTPGHWEEIIPGGPDRYEASTRDVNFAGFNPELKSQLENIEGPSFIPFSEQQPLADLAGRALGKLPGFPKDLSNLGPWQSALLHGSRYSAPMWSPYLMGGMGYGAAPKVPLPSRPVNPALMRRYS